MGKLLIIADDLTGAIDTGIKFSGLCNRVFVIPNYILPPSGIPEETDVLVVNTASRHDFPEVAGKKVQNLMQWAKKQKFQYFYKKTDATLRGNVGIELEMMAREADTKTVIFIPAFPEMGRTVQEGTCFVYGIPLQDTQIAADPFTPVQHSRIKDIISDQSKVTVIECGEDGVVKTDATHPCIRILDCQSDEELRKIARNLSQEELCYTAGCSAFAGALASRYQFTGSSNHGLPLLVCCGSVNETTLKQIHYAKEMMGYDMISLTPKQKLISALSDPGSTLVHEIAERLKEHKKVIISAISDFSELEQTDRMCNELSINPETAHLMIAKHIGRLVAHVIELAEVNSLVLFGGDTLSGCVKSIGGNQIELKGEIIPGVIDTLWSKKDGRIRVITKSGALGDIDVMRSIEKYLLKEGGKA